MSEQNKTPVPVTRGSDPQIPYLSSSLDWLSLTFKAGIPYRVPENFTKVSTEARPQFGYDTARKFSDGRTEMYSRARRDMGYHIILTGNVFEFYGTTGQEVLQFFTKARAKFSRIDLAVDIFNVPEINPRLATHRIESKKCVTKMKQFAVYHDPINPGYTQYFGAPASEARVRMYDKGEEQHVEQEWTRIEAQLRGGKANSAAYMVASGTHPRSVIRGLVDFPEWKAWAKIFTIPDIAVKPKKKPSNTAKWLVEQCAPCLAKMTFLDGGTILDEFMKAYWRELNALRNEGENEVQ